MTQARRHLTEVVASAAILGLLWFSFSHAQVISGGASGPQGAPGTPGSRIWHQSGPPSSGTGADGDTSIDKTGYDVYGKAAGAWAWQFNMRGPAGAQGAQGSPGTNGTNGSNGAAGPAGGFTAYGMPTSRAFAVGTAYQCTDNTKPCILTVTLTSSASFSLLSGVTNTADVVMGTTSGVATSGGTTIARYSNSLTASLAIGIAVATVANSTYTLNMPAGAFMAIRSTGSGTVTVVNTSVEQTVS